MPEKRIELVPRVQGISASAHDIYINFSLLVHLATFFSLSLPLLLILLLLMQS